ncbi:MAG: PDDEXK nuclease domain-containing protein, partial [Candidatus Omnitrophota bacterium]
DAFDFHWTPPCDELAFMLAPTLRCVHFFGGRSVGKMQFYLAALDDTVKTGGENPAIGIIVCRFKKKMTVEYALRESKKPIGVATYRITSHLPRELEKELPSPAQIGYLLGKI